MSHPTFTAAFARSACASVTDPPPRPKRKPVTSVAETRLEAGRVTAGSWTVAQKFTLPWPPTTNRLTAIYRGRNIKTRECRVYKLLAAGAARSQAVAKLTGDVTVELRFFRPRKSGDLDNRIKSVLDALTGLAYADDAQIRRIVAERDDDKANPRVEVVVRTYEAAP